MRRGDFRNGSRGVVLAHTRPDEDPGDARLLWRLHRERILMRLKMGTGLRLMMVGLAGAGISCGDVAAEQTTTVGQPTGGDVQNQSASLVTPPSGVHDPGPRGGPAGAGTAFAGLNATEQAVFAEGQANFAKIDSVTGGIEGEEGEGLGPTFNATGCAECHAQPSVGGTSPAINPQVAAAIRDGATNIVPPFVLANGPIRELRLIA